MAFWLFKADPEDWSWEDQKKAGTAGTEWTGVRNYQARNFMRTMVVGELGFFYHSNSDRAIVGLVRVMARAHRDSTADNDAWECVDLCAVADVPKPVTLAMIREVPDLAAMVLVQNSRLSVQPVRDAEWTKICTMGHVKPVPHA